MSRLYIVQVTAELPQRDGTRCELVTYWYGPKHGLGTTSGGRKDAAVACYGTRFAAEQALRRVFGTVAAATRRGYRVVPWRTGMRESA